ncbi:MAG: DUF3419 family protein, partial [Chlamydiales bacterium]
KKGVLLQGAVERKIKIASFLVRLLRHKKISPLFHFDDLAKQTLYVEKKFDSFLWRRCFDIALHPSVTRIFLKDPGLYEYVDPNIHIGKYIHDRIHNSLKYFLAKESPLLSLLFQGKVNPEYLPPYLTERGVAQIKPRLDRIKFQTGDLIAYIENAPENSFDCFSLSDVASYVPFTAFERMVRAVVRAAKPGARFCIRQFLTKYEIPEALAAHFQRERGLEKQLGNQDRCFVYQFMVGTIQK